MKNPLEFFCPSLRRQVRELNEALLRKTRREEGLLADQTALRKQVTEALAEKQRSCWMFERAKEKHELEIRVLQKERERLISALTEVTAYGETLGMTPSGISLQALEASAAYRKKVLAITNALHSALSDAKGWRELAAAALSRPLMNPAEPNKALPPFVHYNDNAR